MILVQEVKALGGSVGSRLRVRNEQEHAELKVVVKVSEQESLDKRWIKELISRSHDFELLSENNQESCILCDSLAYHKTICNVQYGIDALKLFNNYYL